MRATGHPVFSWIQRTEPGSIPPAVRRGRLYAGDHPDHHHHPHHADHHTPADPVIMLITQNQIKDHAHN